MSGSQELQQLIEVLEQHRSTFGNAQYSFPEGSIHRETLHDFSKHIGQLLRKSYLRIEELFYDSLYWHDGPDEVKEHLYIFIWAQVRSIYRLEGTEGYDSPETIIQKIQAKQTEFITTLEKRIAEHSSHTTQTVEPELIEQVREWAIAGFTMWIS